MNYHELPFSNQTWLGNSKKTEVCWENCRKKSRNQGICLCHGEIFVADLHIQELSMLGTDDSQCNDKPLHGVDGGLGCSTWSIMNQACRRAWFLGSSRGWDDLLQFQLVFHLLCVCCLNSPVLLVKIMSNRHVYWDWALNCTHFLYYNR